MYSLSLREGDVKPLVLKGEGLLVLMLHYDLE